MKPEEKKEYIFPQMRVVVLKYQNKMMQCSENSNGDECTDLDTDLVCEGPDCQMGQFHNFFKKGKHMKLEMKKEYMAPEMEVVEMEYRPDCLNVGSPEVNPDGTDVNDDGREGPYQDGLN